MLLLEEQPSAGRFISEMCWLRIGVLMAVPFVLVKGWETSKQGPKRSLLTERPTRTHDTPWVMAKLAGMCVLVMSGPTQLTALCSNRDVFRVGELRPRRSEKRCIEGREGSGR